MLDGRQLSGVFTYDDWGNCTVITPGPTLNDAANVNPIRYRGYVYDQETGLYYLQSRYYDPETGRFINADDTVFNITRLSSKLKSIIKNASCPLERYTINAYSLNDYELTEIEKDYLSFNFALIFLFDSLNIPIEYLDGSQSWTIDVIYSSPDQGFVENVTLCSERILGGNTKQTCKVEFLWGNAYAYTAYMNQFSDNNERTMAWVRVISVICTIVGVLGIAIPGSAFISTVGSILTFIGLFADGYGEGRNKINAEFRDYVLDMARSKEGDEFFAVIYRVTLITVNNSRKKEEIIYCFGD